MMSDTDVDDDVPFWAVSEFVCLDESCELTVRCNGKQFYIIAEAEDLHGLKEEFVKMLEDEGLHYELEDWVTEPVLPSMNELAPTAPGSLTLAEFYNPETFTFKLVGNDGMLSPVRLPDDTDLNAYKPPKIPLSELATDRSIKSLNASTVTTVPIAGSEGYFGADTPSKVLVDGKQYHFKPVQDRHSFLREISILLELRKTGLDQKCRVPTLYSLVHYEKNEESIMGFLLEVIKCKEQLSSLFESGDTTPQQRQTWVSQIEDIACKLHENGIVWGDVKPNNVLIDEEDNAWVIDFGGGYNSGFVDEDVIETVEGDVQGVSRIKEYLEA